MVDGRPITAASGCDLLAAGEAALGQGDSRAAFDLLQHASQLGVAQPVLDRLVRAYALAGRYQSRQREVLEWLEPHISVVTEPVLRAVLLGTRVILCRGVDFQRVERLVEEALAAAEEVDDEDCYASVLSCAAMAAYRRGDVRSATDYAERASRHRLQSKAAHFEVFRANMFAAFGMGDFEQALNLSIKARAIARELAQTGDMANESNNLAECYLELGCPIEARSCAEQGIQLARRCGYERVEIFGKVLAAMATAECGDVDSAIEQFSRVPNQVGDFFFVDAATAYSYWLIERGADGDPQIASALASQAIASARERGISNRLTPLYSNIARSMVRQGKSEDAKAALEQARLAADRTEPPYQLFLALAVAEVLPSSDPRRNIVLTHARARLLRTAERREDPRAYCTEVRLNRRLLELSGGVPSDLPRAE